LFYNDFSKLILLSTIIACPLTWYGINKWLQNFAYRIDINVWVFVLSGGIALVIALATVSFQAVKAATANPVESLRYE
jgi:putative ABC transport system permease protein